MANAFDVWDVLNDRLIGDCDRDRIVGALRAAGYAIEGGGAAIGDDAHHVLIVGDAAGSACFWVASVPDAALDDELRAALAACRDTHIDNGTIETPEVWHGWCQLALATGARTREDLEIAGDLVPFDGEAVAALTDRWKAFTVGTWNDRIDGAIFDHRIASVTMVFITE